MRAGSSRAVAIVAAAASIGLVAAAPGAALGGPGAAKAGVSAKREVCFAGGARRDLGASYVYEVKARNMGCDRAKKLVKKFHQCRHAHGGWDGRCGQVEGFTCEQKKLDSSPSVLQAKAKCVKGGRKFANTFQENR